MNRIKKLICRNELIQKYAIAIVRGGHVMADPDKYFECPKREPNSKVFLRDEHLEGCQVLSSREKLLEKMPENAVCAEVGVAEGYFSDKILRICKPAKLYMIEYEKRFCENLRKRFASEIETEKVEILEGDSVEMLKKLKDGSLDYVYLDATHDYAHPAKELRVCDTKVKCGGYIMGHDYTRFSMLEARQYGVIEAVNEFIVLNDYEMKYITLDMLSSNSSYAIYKKEFKNWANDNGNL